MASGLSSSSPSSLSFKGRLFDSGGDEESIPLIHEGTSASSIHDRAPSSYGSRFPEEQQQQHQRQPDDDGNDNNNRLPPVTTTNTLRRNHGRTVVSPSNTMLSVRDLHFFSQVSNPDAYPMVPDYWETKETMAVLVVDDDDIDDNNHNNNNNNNNNNKTLFQNKNSLQQQQPKTTTKVGKVYGAQQALFDSKQTPHYVLTVSSDLYQKLLSELHQAQSVPCSLYFCCQSRGDGGDVHAFMTSKPLASTSGGGGSSNNNNDNNNAGATTSNPPPPSQPQVLGHERYNHHRKQHHETVEDVVDIRLARFILIVFFLFFGLLSHFFPTPQDTSLVDMTPQQPDTSSLSTTTTNG
ncbi:hypothetical protein ACA910_020895 [Epithemia clementina (nom. ined.)]